MNENEQSAGLAPTPGYRYAERVGDRLFLAGQVPLDADGTLVGEGDVLAQTEQCLRNLFALVAANGFERRHIRRLTIHVVGEQANLPVAWQVVLAAFDHDVPPATLLGAGALGYARQLVEIDADVVSG